VVVVVLQRRPDRAGPPWLQPPASLLASRLPPQLPPPSPSTRARTATRRVCRDLLRVLGNWRISWKRLSGDVATVRRGPLRYDADMLHLGDVVLLGIASASGEYRRSRTRIVTPHNYLLRGFR
jgi:hypothetical protein